MEHMLNSIELFAGAGGLALGSQRAGIKPAEVVEWNVDCRETIALNRAGNKCKSTFWPAHIASDIRDVNFEHYREKIDLVTGGPPCQPFSLGGKHMAQADNRDMFPEAVRVVRETCPKAFIFENVRGLTRETFRPYFEYITLQMCHPQLVAKTCEDWVEHLQRLQQYHSTHQMCAEDYRVYTKVLNAADFGVPQQRHRVFFVGFRADLNVEWNFPAATHSRDALAADIQTGVYGQRHKLTDQQLALSPNMVKFINNDKYKLTSEHLLPWKTVRDGLHGLPRPTTTDHPNISNHKVQLGARIYPGHTGSPLDHPSKALKAGVHGVPGGENMIRYANGDVRYFTVRESARLQTFPDNYFIHGSWSEAMRQLGNAVPVELAYIISESVACHLRGKKIDKSPFVDRFVEYA